MQKAQIDAREQCRPEKREAKNGLIPPVNQGDDRRDAQRDCKFIHVDFLQTPADCAILEIHSIEPRRVKVRDIEIAGNSFVTD